MIDATADSLGIPPVGASKGGLSDQEFSDKAAAESSLHEFLKQCWHQLEPGKKFIDGEHIRALCLHLEAATSGEIENLIANIPPGFTKSTIVCVVWPAWAWIKNPKLRWMFASYGEDLSLRDALRTRMLVEGEWYQRRWSHVKLLDDQNQKKFYQTTQGGWRISTSVAGRGTGEHPDFFVVDDPMKAADAFSDTVRKAVNEWWDGTISTRGQIRGIRKVIAAQRLHADDLSGHVMKTAKAMDIPDEWVLLKLPMWADDPAKRTKTKIGWIDRRKKGELLWPDGMAEKKARAVAATLGTIRASAQFQQDPIAREGSLFPRTCWPAPIRAVNPKDVVATVRYWDCAGSTARTADYTTGLRMRAMRNGQRVIDSMIRGKFTPAQRDDLIKATAFQDGPAVFVRVEQEPSAGGLSLVDHYVRMLPGFVVRSDRPDKNKGARAEPMSAYCERNHVLLVEGTWNEAFIDELEAFPNAEHDDQVDAATGAFNALGAYALYVEDDHRELIASGDEPPEELAKGFTPEELAELPDYLRDVLTAYDGSDMHAGDRGYGET